jgi:hypothetical protein
MTDPNNFGFDSLLQDLGVPVEIHQNPVVADEPADPEPVVSVTEAVSVTTEEAAAAVIDAAGDPAKMNQVSTVARANPPTMRKARLLWPLRMPIPRMRKTNRSRWRISPTSSSLPGTS